VKDWALILGASSGFGEASALELSKAGYGVYGVHFDRREGQAHVNELRARLGDNEFFNGNAADESFRASVIERIRGSRVRVLLHSLAFGSLRPLIGDNAATRKQLDMTADVMGHSLVYWTQDLIACGAMADGGRIFAMTSEGGAKAVPQYGPVSAAKAVLEAHVRQLAIELAPRGITVNAILAGVTDTPALRKIPGNERITEVALARNPHGRLTRPEDVAKCIVALCDERTYWMTGNTVRVDGGEGSAA
jgi:enoyl-[acyl-carrier protein] reductase III